MREEYIVDPQGRTVRAKHAAKIKQQTLWADIRTANRGHMKIALQQRRRQIVGDCRQLKAGVDSYNDNSNPGLSIQMVFDFRRDLEELERAFLQALKEDGPWLIVAKIQEAGSLPLKAFEPELTLHRFRSSLMGSE